MNVLNFLITIAILAVILGVALAAIYFDEKTCKQEQHIKPKDMPNDEFDYGHNVNYNSNDDF